MRHLIEYIWYDNKQYLRSKIRFITSGKFPCELNVDDIPEWNYDGSSTGQAETAHSEIILVPSYTSPHPFYQENGTLVVCENFYVEPTTREYKPVIGNSITEAKHIFDNHASKEIMYGLEQEFFFYDKDTLQPLAWSQKIIPKEQGKYYCGINRCTNVERVIMDEFMEKANGIGLCLSGINQEVAPSQWEYQIGPVIGIECAHQMTIAKYMMYCLCEQHNLYPVFHPKPIQNRKWNGSGCHINFSTRVLRDSFDTLNDILKRIGADHANFMKEYSGKDNEMRMSGDCETSDWDVFTSGVGDRTASIRIPIACMNEGKGYIEDRRPASNIDYYKTTAYYANLL
jgi:glutamine synthetase